MSVLIVNNSTSRSVADFMFILYFHVYVCICEYF